MVEKDDLEGTGQWKGQSMRKPSWVTEMFCILFRIVLPLSAHNYENLLH